LATTRVIVPVSAWNRLPNKQSTHTLFGALVALQVKRPGHRIITNHFNTLKAIFAGGKEKGRVNGSLRK